MLIQLFVKLLNIRLNTAPLASKLMPVESPKIVFPFAATNTGLVPHWFDISRNDILRCSGQSYSKTTCC
jgi:hypothetical protein